MRGPTLLPALLALRAGGTLAQAEPPTCSDLEGRTPLPSLTITPELIAEGIDAIWCYMFDISHPKVVETYGNCTDFYLPVVGGAKLCIWDESKPLDRRCIQHTATPGALVSHTVHLPLGALLIPCAMFGTGAARTRL